MRDTAIGIEVTNDPEALSAFLQPDCVAAIWHRQTPPDVQNWLDALDPERLPRGRVILQSEAVTSAVDHFCHMTGLPAGPGRDWLQADIALLAERFSDLTGSRFLRLRLDVITSNACRKFHIDSVTARLVCTYRGTGTQYGISNDGHDPEQIMTVQTGSPILLRGTLWPSHPPAGVLHRSPPIEETGETRLLLVLDSVADPQSEVGEMVLEQVH
ncbi:DUF1826 domain-containing protein [Coralliovum pocilloporae]|uniref:DUF1826 domain-containing protein n=1 Tax=Coralliovum pocilloporae TaxID=3066369 RepID=UPI0033073128